MTSPISHLPPSNGNENSSFVHLHLHSLYSPSEGMVRFEPLLDKCKAYGMDAVALTDHGNMCGAIEFYEKAKARGIKPILGCDLYLKNKRAKKESRLVQFRFSTTRLVLLAMNEKGYKRLLYLVSSAYLEDFSSARPCLDTKYLEENNEGLIALSGGLKSAIAWNLIRGQEEEALEEFHYLKKIFGDRFYAELIDSEIQEVQILNSWLIQHAKQEKVKVVASSDVHYLEGKDASSHEILSYIRLGRKLDETKNKYHVNDFWFKSSEWMQEKFSHIPEAIENTIEVSKLCNVELNFTDKKGKTIYHLPTFKIPREEKVKNLNEYLLLATRRGLEWRYKQERFRYKTQRSDWVSLKKTYEDRLKYELGMINQTGFSGYFLIVADFIQWAKNKDIFVGPGRGSGAGSLVAWALRITEIDPIEYELIFERFINPDRITMPDFDVDFCPNRREDVIEYVKELYGKEQVSQVITFGRLQTKNCIRDVGRVLGISYGEVDSVAKLVPDKLGIKMQEALDMEPRLRKQRADNPLVDKMFRHALKLEGLVKNFGKHAGGIIITDKPLHNYSPIYLDEDGVTMIQFDKDTAEKVGLVKFDFLGLRTLTQLQNIVNYVNRENSNKEKLDINNITFGDKKVYELISKGDNLGVFQLESSGMMDLCRKVQPKNIDELRVISAIYRPGPLESGMVDDYIERKHGRAAVVYEDNRLEEALKETFGVIVYQEQVMQSARILAGYSLGEADILRRAMGKKKPEEMAAQKKRFIEGAKKRGLTEAKAAIIFDRIEKFAGYGFPKAHATAYAYLSYQTAYLKYYYPVQFYAALLTTEMSDTDKISGIIEDAKIHNISVLGPDINESAEFFNVTKNQERKEIRFGLGAIKNIGVSASQEILRERESGPFQSLTDFCVRVSLQKVNKKTIESLVKTGAFDTVYVKNTSINRRSLFETIPDILAGALKEKARLSAGQGSFFDQSEGPELMSNEVKIKSLEDWSVMEKLNTEKEYLGFYISGHPLDTYLPILKLLRSTTVKQLLEKKITTPLPTNKNRFKNSGPSFCLAGLITKFKEIMTKKSKRMAFAYLEDLTGGIELVCFPTTYSKYADYLQEGKAVMVKGELEMRRDNPKLLLSEVSLLQDWEEDEEKKSMTFSLDYSQISKEQLDRFLEVLQKHRGDCVGFIECSGPEVQARLKMGKDFSFCPSKEFLMEVSRIFGKNVVEFR